MRLLPIPVSEIIVEKYAEYAPGRFEYFMFYDIFYFLVS